MSKVLVSDVAVINKENFNITDVDYINYLDTSSITNNKILGFQKLDIENDKIPSRAKRKVKNDTIIYSSVRPRLCHFGILKDIPKNTVVSTGFITIDAKEEKIDPYYLYYLLTTNDKIEYISNIADTAVSSYPSINPSDIENMEIDIIDDLEQQREIVAILKSIDKKIENNNKINAELETMAKTIYDYWFLQFEFPNEEGKPYKSSGGKMVWNEKLKREIPEGWECKKLDEIFDFIKGKTPDELFYKKADELIEYLTIEAVNSGTIQYCQKESMITTTGEVLMVMDGAASSDVYVGNIGVIGSTFCKLEIKNNYVDNNFLFLIMKKLEPIFKKVNTGSTVPHANKNYINNFKICLPKDDELRFELQQNIVSCINKIVKNKEQNQELTSLRDFLLPLLMNGQVGFKEVGLSEA